jgi:hypothetical protein
MRSFLRSLENEGARYLLIGGQACVLYGASQFTEDIDLWVRPAARDLTSLLKCLTKVDAVVHKLTPPPSLSLLRRGHGFHFLIPPDTYLDVMGRPPRVGPFAAAWSRARRIKTDWGTLPIVSPEDIVLLKRTNRPSDYEAITNLVRLRREETPDDPRVLRWCLENTFDVDDLTDTAGRAAGLLKRWPARAAVRALLPIPKGAKRVSSDRRLRASRLLALEAADLQERGRRYWIPFLRELKALRAKGGLVPPGTPVRALL